MLAKVTLKCTKCGKDFDMTHGVETQEEQDSWVKWVKDTYKSPYCPECAKAKDVQLTATKGVVGGASVAIQRIAEKIEER